VLILKNKINTSRCSSNLQGCQISTWLGHFWPP